MGKDSDTNLGHLQERVSQLETTLGKIIERMEPQSERYMDLDSACRFMGICKKSLYRLMNKGELGFTMVGRQRRILISEMVHYINENYVTPKPSIL